MNRASGGLLLGHRMVETGWIGVLAKLRVVEAAEEAGCD
jgi:hypothetical protein